jgi:membrane protease YdiL (CAAX protease family)
MLLEIPYLYLRTQLHKAAGFQHLTQIQHELMWSGLRAASIVAVLFTCWRYELLPDFFTKPKIGRTTIILLFLYVILILVWPKSHGQDLSVQMTFAATTIFVAVREELVYRYVIQNWIEGWLLPKDRIFGSILFTSILFTLYHLGVQPITSFPWIFLTSVLLGAIYISSGKSLFLVITCHFIIDVFFALY